MNQKIKKTRKAPFRSVPVLFLTMFFLIAAGLCSRLLPALSTRADTSGNESDFTIHFIDVGQADAALVLCDGKSMLIDGGNTEDSSLIYSYLEKLDIGHLDYVVCTHAHEDHVGGLSGALNFAEAETILCPVTTYESKAFKNFQKYVSQQNKSITVPKAGDTYPLGSSTLQILGPLRGSDNTNNTSIVMKIIYKDTSFLFTGDAERDEEQDILASGCDLSSTVLKVGHHGSDTSTSYPFLREIMPEYAVISVGKNNIYGHPSENTLSRLRDAGVQIYRTDQLGDIICCSDGKTVSFRTEKKAVSADETNEGTSESSPEYNYVLNTNTKKFHLPSCPSINDIKGKNKKQFSGTREDAIAEGYSPCGRCKP